MKLNKKLIAIPSISLAAGLGLAACGASAPVPAKPLPVITQTVPATPAPTTAAAAAPAPAPTHTVIVAPPAPAPVVVRPAPVVVQAPAGVNEDHAQNNCGGGVYAGSVTSCAFALNVAAAYSGGGGSDVETVSSPVTGQSYVMSYQPYAAGMVEATGGNGALVIFNS